MDISKLHGEVKLSKLGGIVQISNMIDLDQSSLAEIGEMIALANQIRNYPKEYCESCRGKIMATLFYEPSTRTKMSFKRQCSVWEVRSSVLTIRRAPRSARARA